MTNDEIMALYDVEIARGGSADSVIQRTVHAALARNEELMRRISRMLAEMQGDDLLTEGQCCHFLGIDRVTWRETVHAMSIGSEMCEPYAGE